LGLVDAKVRGVYRWENCQGGPKTTVLQRPAENRPPGPERGTARAWGARTSGVRSKEKGPLEGRAAKNEINRIGLQGTKGNKEYKGGKKMNTQTL